ncbi:MAG: helix-turn-helix domain-containing protein [Bacteroidetes bacterium]|nr:helix-turn-helix domain-containing protein [Bacteroidota bacterium]
MMPVMDGFQLLEKLKSDDRWRHLPVIMLTAKVNIRSKLEALRIGVDDYLTKPFQEEELKARIENLLHNYRERMEFHSQNKIETGEEAAAPNKPIIAAVDTTWLQEVEGIYTKHLNDDLLNVDFAAGKLNLSERQFSRRLQQLTGLSPNHYLQEMRLQRARDLLLDGRITAVKEAAFMVGFHDVRYFSSLFEKRFGSKPSDLRK